MGIGDDFLFNNHQFILGILALFFSYFSWRDVKANTFEGLPRISKNFAIIFLNSFFVGLSGYFMLEWGSVGLVLSVFIAFLITLSLYDPKYAVAYFIFTLVSRPWEFINDQIFLSFPRDIFFICILSFLAHRIFRKKYFFQWNTTSSLVFLYACWVFFSTFVTNDPSRAMVEYGEVFIKGIIVFFLIVNVVDKKEFVLPIQVALILAITEKAIVTFYNSIILGNVADGGRLLSVGIFENSNDIAAIMILAIPFTLALFRHVKIKPLKYFAYFVILTFYSLMVWEAKSRGAILGIGLLYVIWFWLAAKNKKRASFIVLISGVGILLAMNSIKRDEKDIEGSTSNRMIYWKAGINMGIRKPLLGVGYNNYNLRLLEFTNGHVGSEGKYKTIHSTWLLTLAETGVPGFLFYIGIWLFSLRCAWRMREVHPEYLLALGSYGTAISFLSHTYMLYPWILLGLIVASAKFYNEKKSAITLSEMKMKKPRWGERYA